MNFRVGFGFDVHRLAEGETLNLGGIIVPFSKGTVGHSDADVLIHAICDALLGAAALRDIGVQFPDNASEYKGIDSKILLGRVAGLLQTWGYAIGNIDCTLCLQQPKIKDDIPRMQQILADVLRIEVHQISVKATTTEKLGYVGRGEGVSAYAVCLIYKTD